MSYIGTNKIGKMYLGSTEIAKAYLGNDLVYQNKVQYTKQSLNTNTKSIKNEVLRVSLDPLIDKLIKILLEWITKKINELIKKILEQFDEIFEEIGEQIIIIQEETGDIINIPINLQNYLKKKRLQKRKMHKRF